MLQPEPGAGYAESAAVDVQQLKVRIQFLAVCLLICCLFLNVCGSHHCRSPIALFSFTDIAASLCVFALLVSEWLDVFTAFQTVFLALFRQNWSLVDNVPLSISLFFIWLFLNVARLSRFNCLLFEPLCATTVIACQYLLVYLVFIMVGYPVVNVTELFHCSFCVVLIHQTYQTGRGQRASSG